MNVIIVGATSAIAQAAAREFAARGCTLYLIARNAQKLGLVAADLKTRSGREVQTRVLDLCETAAHPALLAEAERTMGPADVFLVAHGVLGDQARAIQSYETARGILEANFLSVVSMLTSVSNVFEARRSGTIAVISSVAGDRGRQSNYVYGVSKGAVSIFLQGLRNRLAKSNVHVVTIKPGFVDTPMTAAFKKGLLFASADTVGRGVVRAILKKKDVVYVPGFWRLIMIVICLVPERIFKRLSL
ncbi:MAG TPA: SDR family oxidoreductase [Bdellovibrionales bacterium]|nr:SDR family oxidoreductase [Bdellovibrionales bacterium]